MQLHHIIQEAEGGADTMDNCIPLCLDCHAEVGSYNPRHPIGKKFSPDELRKHRNLWFDFVKTHPERLSSPTEGDLKPDVKVCVEFEHVLQTWGYPDWPAGKKSEEHLLRVWLRNDGTNAASHVDGTIGIPSIMSWEENPFFEALRKGTLADTSLRRSLRITNEQFFPRNGLISRPREKRPLLPKRRMTVHEERLLFKPVTAPDYSKITWEVGADNSKPMQGEILFRDIPIVDERNGG